MFYFHCFYIFREAPQLEAVLKEMKEGLDIVDIKVRALTAKVNLFLFSIWFCLLFFLPLSG